MIKLYLKNVSALPDPMHHEQALLGIPRQRLGHILKYRRACDRKLSLGAWRVLEDALLHNGLSADNVVIGKNGKPECESIYFNLSHSADTVICAVSDVPVGCDIEKAENAPLDIAERCFTKKERRYIFGSDDTQEIDQRFFRLWTLKESYMKMTGEGLGIDPLHIEVDLDTSALFLLRIPQSCTVKTFKYQNYIISVCVHGRSPKDRFEAECTEIPKGQAMPIRIDM